jgi:IclR family KDG regulon transcriptional repressor
MEREPAVKEPRQGRYAAPAAGCAADVLYALARSGQPLSTTEIARALEASKSLVFRVVRELESRRLLERVADSRFRLGVGALEIGGSYAASADHLDLARQVLRDLARSLRESVHLGVLRGSDVFYLLTEHPPDVSVTISYVGNRLPANCTALGKALLARLTREQVARLFAGGHPALTPRSLASAGALRDELERVRTRGYATVDGEAIRGRAAIGICVELAGLGEPAGLAVASSDAGFLRRRAQVLRELEAARQRLERGGAARLALDGERP